MADTTNFGWTKPTVAGDNGAWGAKANTLFDDIDTDLKTVSDAVTAAQTDADLGVIAAAENIAFPLLYLSASGNLIRSTNSPAVTYPTDFDTRVAGSGGGAATAIFAIPLTGLKPGQRITGFKYSAKNGTGGLTSTVTLYAVSTAGATTVVGSDVQSIVSASYATYTKSGLSYTVLADTAYILFVQLTVTTTGNASFLWAQPTVVRP
jgi:hypothetical protein